MGDPAAVVHVLPHVMCAREPLVGANQFGALLRRDALTGCDSQDAVIIVNPPNVDEHFAAAWIHLCAAFGWTHDEIHCLEPPWDGISICHQRVTRKACPPVWRDIPGPFFGSYSYVSAHA